MRTMCLLPIVGRSGEGRTWEVVATSHSLMATMRQYYTLLEQKAIILIFISIIDINVNLSKNEIDKKINLS